MIKNQSDIYMTQIPEPSIHDDDTNPSIVTHPAQNDSPTWQQAIGWISLLGATVFTLATIVVLFLPQGEDNSPNIVSVPTEPATALPAIPTDIEAVIIETDVVPQVIQGDSEALPPIISAEQFSTVLESQITNNSPLLRVLYNPFTVVNADRARSGFLDYTVVQGDTMDEISTRYGLQSESIGWCNDRRVVVALRPGDVLRIPPVDGACHEVYSTLEETIEQIAINYEVSDPYTIIDSEYNRNQLPPDVTPTDTLLGSTYLFIPGGIGEVITWDVGTQETDASGNVIGVGFANGLAGSCGSVTPSGFAYWSNPLPSGTWVRGFTGWHSGLDLAAPTGTPIYAANSGNVIFSGISTWGYGEAVVLEHGAVYSTLYGHMSQRNVSCGQFVTVGQVIGYVGSTGDSTGPHLHFEIQVNNIAVNPSGTPGIDW
ncbi:MAG: hypothetical protein Phog2KO_13090 [Phototrophicaceae bacterium]